MKKSQKIESLDSLRSIFGLPEQVENPSKDDAPEKNEPKEQHSSADAVRIHLVRLKGNKEATVIRGVSGNEAFLENLCRTLKQHCGVGGSSKNGEILLQGNHRERVLKWFQEKGYKQTKLAGG
jgi:translation initiation factor 1